MPVACRKAIYFSKLVLKDVVAGSRNVTEAYTLHQKNNPNNGVILFGFLPYRIRAYGVNCEAIFVGL
jgi:hypothetical protein